MHLALQKDYIDSKIVSLLLNNKASIDALDHQGKTPLCYALEGSQLEELKAPVVSTLLEQGADLSKVVNLYKVDESGQVRLNYVKEKTLTEKTINDFLAKNPLPNAPFVKQENPTSTQAPHPSASQSISATTSSSSASSSSTSSSSSSAATGLSSASTSLQPEGALKTPPTLQSKNQPLPTTTLGTPPPANSTTPSVSSAIKPGHFVAALGVASILALLYYRFNKKNDHPQEAEH